MIGKRLFVIAIVMMLATHGCAEDITPSQIFEKVRTSYESMETYKAQGTTASDIDTGGMKVKIETSFSILLKKPNMYLISWSQKDELMSGIAQSGAVWSDGTQPYLYIGGKNAFFKMGSDELALGAAAGNSGVTMPSFFLSVFKEQFAPFSRLKDPQIEMTEKVGEEDCYVITGSSSISKKEAFWISKTSYLVKKYYRSLEPPEGGYQMPEMRDEQVEEAIKGMGQEVTEESKQKMREMMKRLKEDALKTGHIKGSTTELYAEISSPNMTISMFQFELPEGTVLQDSLYSRDHFIRSYGYQF